METEADDLCVYVCVRVCMCVCVCVYVEPSVNKATTVHLSGKTDDILHQFLLFPNCWLLKSVC